MLGSLKLDGSLMVHTLLTGTAAGLRTLCIVQDAWMMATITKTMIAPMTQYKLIVVRLEFQLLRLFTSRESGDSAPNLKMIRHYQL